MKPLAYVDKEDVCDRNYKRYEFSFVMVDIDDVNSEETEKYYRTGKCYPYEDFEKFVKRKKPRRVIIDCSTQEELEYLVDNIYEFVSSLRVDLKHNKAFDLTPLEKCSELETVEFYWNIKQESLWDVKKNSKLKSFHMMDYYKVSDFSAFRGSSIETLELFGCNGCSSFVSKMHIDDLSFILDMPKLRVLRLDIIKDEPSEYYLNLFAKCTGLELFGNPHSFFTFQQFAWLKAHLPNVKKGLDCVCEYCGVYSIIGRRTPKAFTEYAKSEKYQKRYDALVEKYRSRTTPPSDEEKD